MKVVSTTETAARRPIAVHPWTIFTTLTPLLRFTQRILQGFTAESTHVIHAGGKPGLPRAGGLLKWRYETKSQVISPGAYPYHRISGFISVSTWKDIRCI
jgi:hypothetical protein